MGSKHKYLHLEENKIKFQQLEPAARTSWLVIPAFRYVSLEEGHCKTNDQRYMSFPV
jgi:hypothetical protein